jgi:hypothetical protein
MHVMARPLLKSASVIALLSGSLLLPSAASAQFGFPNIQFRVPYMGGGNSGHYRTRHHKTTHELSRHEKRSNPEEEEESTEHAQGNGKSAPQALSAPLKDTPPPPQGSASAAAPKPPGGEEPAFSPSR